MAKRSDSEPRLSRRSLLSQAGAITAATALKPFDPVLLQAQKGSRNRQSFDLGWEFYKGELTLENAGDTKRTWRKLDLPHDWSIEGPFDAKEKADGYLPSGFGWYRKRFSLPKGSAGRKVTLEFDGVYQRSEVWLNGHSLGFRPSGYIPFAYDLTPYLNPKGENLLFVKVDNSLQSNSRWYSGSGIYRHVWLNVTGPVHIDQWGVFVTCPSVKADSATVQVRTTVLNSSPKDTQCALRTTILDASGTAIQSVETTQPAGANGKVDFIQQVVVTNPSLWSCANPNLYSARSEVRVDGAVLDDLITPFGIREAIFDAKKGFLLNGTRVKLNGVCLHHDGGAVGAAVPLRVWERRLSILKEMGCNAIRTSHNPVASEFLDLCDRMGFLVMAEAFDEWRYNKRPQGYGRYFDEWYERDLVNFVRRDRNHPCIILWSAGNEIGDQHSDDGTTTLKKLIAVFHREDPTRLVTAGCDQIASEPLENRVRPEFFEALDVVGYNYADRWRERVELYYSADREDHPNWRVVGTESSSMSGVRGDYKYLFPGEAIGFSRNTTNRMLDVELLWRFVCTHDYVAGEFMWTGLDHLGEARWPNKGSSTGPIDICGFKKDGFYFYQSQWTTASMLHLFPHWNWAGKDGHIIPVACYTNCDTVELFLNGRSLGVKGYDFPRQGMQERWPIYPKRAQALRTTSDLHLTWDVPYEPGTLKAVGTREGKAVLETEVATTGTPASVQLIADRSRITTSGEDVCHLEFRIVDKYGRVVPGADNELTLEVSGAGHLIGFDSGDPASHEDYRSNKRRAFHGLALGILRSLGKEGTIKVAVSSPGLVGSEATIAVHS